MSSDDTADRAVHREPQTPKPYPYLRRNFILGLVNGIFIRFAYSFADPNTIMPVFVITLTGSHILAGVISGLFEAGWLLPQMLVSNVVQHRTRKLPLYRAMAFVRSGAWAAVAISIFLIGTDNNTLLFWIFLLCYLGVCLGAGVAGVPFMDVAAKFLPPGRRGSFFAYRRMIGGMLGIGAGFIVARVLSPESSLRFPYSYGLLFTFTAILVAIALSCFSLVREPLEPVDPKRVSFRTHLANCGRIFREDVNYRRYYTQRVLHALGLMALPFFATYAVTELGAQPAQVGVMVSLWMLSGMLSNLMWGILSDRMGTRVLVVAAAALSAISPVIALASVHVPSRPVEIPSAFAVFAPECLSTLDLRLLVFLSCFVLNGFADAARKVSSNAYLLDISPSTLRPTYVGLMNTLSAPLSFSPALGGLITQAFSYQTVFCLALVFALLSLLVSLRLAGGDPPAETDRHTATRAT